MNAKCKICIALTVFITLFVLMQGCLALGPSVSYKKKDVNLYSEAIHSLLGVYSSGMDEIFVLDEDEYGRKLFFANLSRSSIVGDIAGIFISQNTDDSYAYYYEDRNYIVKAGCINKVTKEKVYEKFSSETIKTIKEQNDWGKEERSRDCFKVPIRGDKFYLNDQVSDKSINAIVGTILYKRTGDIPMCEDSFGHIIWFAKGLVSEEDPQERYYVFFFNADGTLKGGDAIMEIDDIWNYSEQMISFKEANHWNQEE